MSRRDTGRCDRVAASSGALGTLDTVRETPTETARFQAYRGSAPPRFVNGAERECARILDWYGIPWEYEPRSFVLERDAQGRVTSAFTPDFYLPEQDLYIEVTVMKQSLVTRKNRKLREVRRLYPDVKVKLFYRRDIERLAQRYRLRIAS
jgi:hypoxanthine phosphoribosyltransferase